MSRILHREVKYMYNFSTRIRKCSDNTIVMGIETSCDDTGCALVNDSGKVLGESLFSQNVIHLRYGGVNPLFAYELHRNNIEEVVNQALSAADVNVKSIDAIAVTTKPGLLISLQIGVKFAKYIARKYNKPIIPIHHMEAHALVGRLYKNIPFPFLVLLISGGHCLLAVVRDVDKFILLGESMDNAPGEVLDKVSRRMKLKNIPEYSKVAGGRAVELAAKEAKHPNIFQFTLPLLRSRDCNFSFSGLKDSLVRKLLQKEQEHQVIGNGVIPEVFDLCAAFQIAVAEHLGHRTERALLFCEKFNMLHGNQTLVVSGGVACNDFIFKFIEFIGHKNNFEVFRPPPHLCTDNGIMIAWNGMEKLKKQIDVYSDILVKDAVDPVAPLGKDLTDKVKEANLSVKITRLNKLLTT